MRLYSTTYKFYYNNEEKSCRSNIVLLDNPDNKEISGNDFNSLWNLAQEYIAVLPIRLWTRKKGHVIEFYNQCFGHVYEWKNNCKPWKLVINYSEITAPMKELMNFDSESVIKYLKDIIQNDM